MICFVVALKKEAQSLLEKVENLKEFLLADKPAYSFNINNTQCILAISGIGKVSAGLTTQLLIDKFNPKFIINFGTCGGMNNSVKILHYYLADKCCQYDFDLSALDDVPVGYIQEYDRVYFDTYTHNINFLQKRAIASADKFTHKSQDVELINKMNCSICDMEAGAIAQVCTSNNIPLIVVKGISDVHGNNTQPEQFFKNLSTVSNNFPDVIKQVIDSIKL